MFARNSELKQILQCKWASGLKYDRAFDARWITSSSESSRKPEILHRQSPQGMKASLGIASIAIAQNSGRGFLLQPGPQTPTGGEIILDHTL